MQNETGSPADEAEDFKRDYADMIESKTESEDAEAEFAATQIASGSQQDVR